MTNINNLTTSQLNRIIVLKEKIEELQAQIDSLANDGGEIPSPISIQEPKKRGMSAAAKARIAAGQKARWAKVKAAKGESASAEATPKKRRKMSAASKAKMAAAAKARWAKAKAAGKTSL